MIESTESIHPMEYWMQRNEESYNSHLHVYPKNGEKKVRPIEISQFFNLETRSRKRHNVYNRHYFNHYCRNVLKMDLCTIAKVIGRDHATVLHGCKMHDELSKDKIYLEYITGIKDAVKEINTYKKSTQWRLI